jgi:hypothetical protein
VTDRYLQIIADVANTLPPRGGGKFFNYDRLSLLFCRPRFGSLRGQKIRHKENLCRPLEKVIGKARDSHIAHLYRNP